MSEEITLSGAFFDNNMPKWATEETMKRMGLEFKRDRSVSKKQNDKMVSILGKIVQTMNKSDKANKDQVKSLSDISKQLKESIKTDKEILAELKKSNKSSGKAASSTAASGGANSSGDSADVESAVQDNTHVLEKINRSIATMTTEIMKNMDAYNSSMKDVTKHQKRSTSAIRRSMSSDGSNTDRLISDSLDDMSERLENSKSYSRGARTSDLISSEISPSRNRAKKFNGRLGTMIASMGTFITRIKDLIGKVFALIKKIPLLGAAVSAAATAIGAAMDFNEIVTQSFDNYKEMIQSGMNFTEEVVNGTRMDGIRLRKMIAQAGVTFEVGLNSLKRNVTMINDIGVGDYLDTIKNVMGNAQDASAFMNKVMMSQKDIMDFSATYLENLKAIGAYERLNSEDRARGIQSFIKNTKMLSEITGQSMEYIKGLMKDATSDARLKVMMSGMSTDQQETIEKTMSALAAQLGGTSTEMYRGMLEAITDPTKGGLMRTSIGPELQRFGALLGDDKDVFFSSMDEIARDIATGNVAPENIMLRLHETLKGAMDGITNMEEGNRDAILATMDKDGPLYNLVANIYDAAKVNVRETSKVKDVLNSGGIETGVDGRTSRTAALERQMQNAQEQAEAATQAALATAADSDMSRGVLEGVYKGMIYASDITERAANAAVATGHVLSEYIPKMASNLYSILGIMDDDYESREKRVEKIIGAQLSDMNASQKVGRDQIKNDLKHAGLKTNLIDGERSPHTSQFHQNMKKLEGLNLDVESLLEETKNANEAVASGARETLAYMASTQMKGVISGRERIKYKKALEKSMEGFSQEQQDMFYAAIERALLTGTGVNKIVGKVREKAYENSMGVNAFAKDTPSRTQEHVDRARSEREQDEEREKEKRNVEKNTSENKNQDRNNTTPEAIDKSENAVDRTDTNVSINNNNDVTPQKLDEMIRTHKIVAEEQIKHLRNINDTLKQNRNSGSVSS